MADTFLARTITSDGAPTVEGLVYGGPLYIEHASMLGIMNNVGSNRLITIKSIDFNEQLGRSTTAQVRCQFVRTTAQAGGEALSPIKMDSNVAAIPSQVLIAKYPTELTTTGSPFREINMMDGFMPGTALMGLLAANAAVKAGGLGIADFTAQDTNVQGMVLREGQGIVITTALAAPTPFEIEVRLHLLVGSDMHIVSEVIPFSSHAAVIGVYNGSGSGVVVTLVRSTMRQIATSDVFRAFSIERFNNMDGGWNITPVPMDSTATGLSSGVWVRRNGACTQAGEDAKRGAQPRAGGDLPFRKVALPYFGIHPQLASLNIWKSQRAMDSKQTFGDILLREGEGLGVFQKPLASGRGGYEIIVTFTATVTGSTGGGETSHVF